MGKGKSSSPPPQMQQPQSQMHTIEAPSIDLTPMYATMAQMMAMQASSQDQSLQQMRQMQSQLQTAAPKPADPDITTNWKARADALREKISATEMDAAGRRRGRESTILTSPLTDEDISTTESVLKGS